MNQPKIRIPPLPREEWTNAAREVFAFWGEPDAWENGSKINITMVQAHHPKLALAYNAFGKHLLIDSALPVRPRELVVLRTAWHLKAEYEWHYHVGYAVKAGMTLEEIMGVRNGPDDPIWNGKDEDNAVLRAVDELWETSHMTDETWGTLSTHFDKHQIMDLVFTIGNYVMLGWSINVFGVQLEDGVDRIGWDLRAASGKLPVAGHRPGERK
jgi:4-carboxymuconolactone decarboxylase